MKRPWFEMALASAAVLAALACAILLVPARTLQGRPAGTAVCGTITANTTWTVISSLYVVCSGFFLNLAQGVTLTIQPGVEVQLQSNGIDANGTLLALGTASAPITFTGVTKTSGSWQGLNINGSLTQTNRLPFRSSW